MFKWKTNLTGGLLAVMGLAGAAAHAATQVTFFYPVQVSGPLTKVIDGTMLDLDNSESLYFVRKFAVTYLILRDEF